MGGAGAIPYMAISQYARDHGIEGYEFVRCHRLVRACDGAFLRASREKREREKGAGGGRSHSQNRRR